MGNNNIDTKENNLFGGCGLTIIGIIFVIGLLSLGNKHPIMIYIAVALVALIIIGHYLDKNKDFSSIKNENKEIKKYNESLKIEIDSLKKQLTPEQLEVADLKSKSDMIKVELDNLTSEKNTLQDELDNIKKEINLGNLELEYHEIGLYKPMYDFATSEKYKIELDNIREQQKEMVKDSSAIVGGENFTMNGSVNEGKKVIKDNKKQLLRMFNNECTVLIDKVKYNNYDSILSRIKKSYEQLNKMNERMTLYISETYLQLKEKELALAYEYAKKKQEEKEAAKAERERLREEAKLQKEIEDAKKSINKEKKHYSSALENIEEKLRNDPDNEELISKKSELQVQLEEIEKNLKDIDYREANKRAGYVYVISNIGSFGENIYKIGMTRRLEPMERVYELGDASVPFNFDVHAMIFSDDAPKLEAALHNAFDDKKVNMVNTRREFFNVTLEEIEKVVKENYDKTVEFTKNADADQYRESLIIKNNLGK